MPAHLLLLAAGVVCAALVLAVTVLLHRWHHPRSLIAGDKKETVRQPEDKANPEEEVRELRPTPCVLVDGS